MSDFYQTGAIATLHRLGTPDVARLERELGLFAAETPIALVLPCHIREVGTKALRGIARELKQVSYLKEIVVGIDGANLRSWKKARRFFAQLPQKPMLLWNDGPRMKALFNKLEDAEQLPLLAARFDFEDGLRLLDKSELLMVLPEGQTLLSFQACHWDRLPIPSGPVQLMVLLEDGTAAIVDAESFRSQVQAQAAPRPFLNSITLRTRRVPRDEAFASLPARSGSDASSRAIP
jgi:hypothetical protein